MAALIPQKMFDEQLAAMDIENFAQATIRQVGAVGGALEKNLSLIHISEPTRPY